jgi:hypothetical protein
VGTVANGQPIDTSTLGDHSFTVVATDNYGLTTSTTVGYFVEAAPVDTTPPTVSISAPANNVEVAANAHLVLTYSCADGGAVVSGIATCSGPVASGGTLDTRTVGRHDVTVTAIDHAGRSATATVSYVVKAAAVPVQERRKDVVDNSKGVPSSPPLSELLGKDGTDVKFNGDAGYTVGGQVIGNIGAGGTVTPGNGAPVISVGGGNATGGQGGNVISVGGGNVISVGGGNVISVGGGNFSGRALLLDRAKPKPKPKPKPRKPKPKPVVLAQGGHTFAADGTAEVRIKLTPQGRKIVLAARAKANKLRKQGKKRLVKPLVLQFTTISGRADGGAKVYYTTKRYVIRL